MPGCALGALRHSLGPWAGLTDSDGQAKTKGVLAVAADSYSLAGSLQKSCWQWPTCDIDLVLDLKMLNAL